LDPDFRENTIVESLHFHGGFIRFDLGKNITDFDSIADLFVPLDQGAFGHGVREFRHFYIHSHHGMGKCRKDGKTRGEFQSFYRWIWQRKRKSAGSLMLLRASK
jgi:hypothetical protein